MAGGWFHASVKTVKRSSGRSAVAAAAYRAGIVLHDERTGLTHDYTRKAGVAWTAILLPESAPADLADPARLWNAAESAEKRKNSVTARELELALPAELTDPARRIIAEAVARFLVERYGVAAHVAIHRPHRDGDERNDHAHILFTTRRLGPQGFGEKTRELDDARDRGPKEIEAIRESAAAIINRELERAGIAERVDHRSNERRGIEAEPTQHLGPTATAMERSGEASDRGDQNRETEERNRERDDLQQQAQIIDLAIERERRRLAEIEEQRRAAKAQEKANLAAYHKGQRQALYDAKERRIAEARAASQDRHRHFWRALFAEQERERRDLEQAQRGALSRLGVWLRDRSAGKLDAQERGMLSGAFRALIGKDAAAERMAQRHEAQRADLGAKISEKTRAVFAEINSEYRAELDRLTEVQQQEREAEAEAQQEQATGTNGRSFTATQPEAETEEQADERRRAFIAEIEQERARLRSDDRERGGPER